VPCILVVEDDPDAREFMSVLLTSSGYEIMSASNGLEALVRMRQRRPCLVLLDMQMPVMDGWTFRERQLADPALAAVPVICVTAFFDPVDVERKLELRCLGKPIVFALLLTEVAEMCGHAPE
jgi:chemosensory pili system protein ChpA (sensor histidine kinase/response regulator)